jgi:membrane protease YdiL (CAAX protease family)
MAAARIELKTLLLTLLSVTTAEFMAARIMQLGASNPLVVTGVARLLELLMMMAILVYSDRGLAAVGVSTTTAARGFSKGLIWAAGFGCVVAGVALVISLWGINPLQLIRIPLPSDPTETLQLFLVGGIVGPVTEELFFRGILYGYFRRWGFFPALFVSTLFFVLLHPIKALAVTQTVGGVLFAAAYEIEGNLLVPVTIHALGNLAIFSLAFLV